jgi:hypothetical protein
MLKLHHKHFKNSADSGETSANCHHLAVLFMPLPVGLRYDQRVSLGLGSSEGNNTWI